MAIRFAGTRKLKWNIWTHGSLETKHNPSAVQGNNGMSLILLKTSYDRQSNVETLKWYEKRIRMLQTQCEEMESVRNRMTLTQC